LRVPGFRVQGSGFYAWSSGLGRVQGRGHNLKRISYVDETEMPRSVKFAHPCTGAAYLVRGAGFRE
jgi:hypothetical protein